MKWSFYCHGPSTSTRSWRDTKSAPVSGDSSAVGITKRRPVIRRITPSKVMAWMIMLYSRFSHFAAACAMPVSPEAVGHSDQNACAEFVICPQVRTREVMCLKPVGIPTSRPQIQVGKASAMRLFAGDLLTEGRSLKTSTQNTRFEFLHESLPESDSRFALLDFHEKGALMRTRVRASFFANSRPTEASNASRDRLFSIQPAVRRFLMLIWSWSGFCCALWHLCGAALWCSSVVAAVWCGSLVHATVSHFFWQISVSPVALIHSDNSGGPKKPHCIF